MKMRQLVGIAMLMSVGLALLTAFMLPENEDLWYMLAGFGFLVFGTWGGILLIKE